MQKTFVTMAMVLALAAPSLAQDRDDEQRATAPSKPAVAKADDQKPAETKPAAAAPVVRPEPTTNIRIELTITDQRGTAAPISKIVTMTMMDTGNGRIRTGGDVKTPLGFRPVTLNVDAYPRVHKDGKIRVDLTIEYRPTAAESDTEQATTPTINESIAVLLEDGKSVVISQSADPATDRKVKVEAKATIIR
jgi:hypothetical protein